MYNIAELCISFMKIMMKSILPMAVQIIQKLVIYFLQRAFYFYLFSFFKNENLPLFPFLSCVGRGIEVKSTLYHSILFYHT